MSTAHPTDIDRALFAENIEIMNQDEADIRNWESFVPNQLSCYLMQSFILPVAPQELPRPSWIVVMQRLWNYYAAPCMLRAVDNKKDWA